MNIIQPEEEWNVNICNNRMDPDGIMIRKVSQQRQYTLNYMWNPKEKTKLIDAENRLVVVRGGGAWKGQKESKCINFQLENKSWGGWYTAEQL